jgi:uncharacterized membrane protein SpoIIM required for sporulation
MKGLYNLFFNPEESENHLLSVGALGFFYATISLFLSIWLFPEYASLLMIFLCTISCIYLFERAFILEEKKEKDSVSEQKILKKHAKIIFLFLAIFIGFLLAFTFWTIALPDNLISSAFSIQIATLNEIQAITGNAVSPSTFSIIMLNNSRVLILSLIFALFYGAGAIFILAWNASIMGFVIGNLAKHTFGLSSLPILFTKYFIHGILEMVAYFIAALAGGIMFIAIIKEDLRKFRLKRTLMDFFILIAISFGLLLIAALLETFVSPLI